MTKNDKDTSKYIALILRHKPQTIGITLDEHGWADVNALIEGVNKTHPLDMESFVKMRRSDTPLMKTRPRSGLIRVIPLMLM